MERRRFLRFVAAAPAASLVGCRRRAARPPQWRDGGAPPPRCAVSRREGKGRVLTRAEWSALEAACERLFPADADPGAAELGAANYIDDQLRFQPIAAFLPLIRAGARFLDVEARRRGAASFGRLAAAAQQAVVETLPRRRVGRYRGGRFLRVLLALTLEACFGDPIYGGNAGGRGWKMIAFTPQRPAPRCPYRGRRR